MVHFALMKIHKIEASAVRTSGAVRRATSLADRELRAVVGSVNPECEEVPPEICAIHDYYIVDVLE